MYYTLENHNKTIGGVCGYMGLKLERTGEDQEKITEDLDFFTKIFLNFVDIQRAQQLEYHFAHLIDKGFESIFKFIHVLPGAFSGYNMKAIWGDGTKNADELLESYFKSIGDKVSNKKYDSVDLSFWKILARVILPNFVLRCFTDKNRDTYE
jgi:chitin synthase